MSTIGFGAVAFIPLIGIVVVAAAAVAAAAVVAGGVTLIGAGVKGTMYCGGVLKNKLNEREQQIIAEEQAYYNAALANQSETDQAIQSLADSIIVETFTEMPVLQIQPTPPVQAVEKMRENVAQLQAQLAELKSAEEASRFLKQYRVQRAAEQRKQEVLKKQRQLKNRLDSAVKAGLSADLAKGIESTLQVFANIPYEQALSRWQEGMRKLDEWFMTQAAQSQVAFLRYENQRAMQEFEEAALYVQRERLSAAQDIDLGNWVADALQEAESILNANQTRLDQDPSSARTEIEKARLSVVNAMADARERLRHAREDLKSQVEATRAKLQTVAQMIKEMEMIGISVETASQVSQLARQLDDLETSARQKTKPIAEIREGVFNLKLQAIQLRASLERDLARRQREGIAKAIEEVLNELNYQSETEQRVSAEAFQNAWRVAGYMPTNRGKAGVIFRVTEDAEGNMKLWHDFQGFRGKECMRAKEEIFSRLRKRGVQIAENPEDQHVFDTHLYQETIERLMEVLKAMRYQNISVSDIAGAVKIEAYDGPVGYTIRLASDGEAEVYKDTSTGRVKQSLDEFEKEAKEAGQTLDTRAQIEGEYAKVRRIRERAALAHR